MDEGHITVDPVPQVGLDQELKTSPNFDEYHALRERRERIDERASEG